MAVFGTKSGKRVGEGSSINITWTKKISLLIFFFALATLVVIFCKSKIFSRQDEQFALEQIVVATRKLKNYKCKLRAELTKAVR